MTTAERHGIHVEHAMPGRLRVKYRPMKTNPALAEQLQEQLSSIEGVTHVDTHPTIGGVTVHYHPESARSADFLFKLAEAFGLSAIGLDPQEVEGWVELLSGRSKAQADTELEESMASLTRMIEDGIGKLSRRDVNPGLLVPLALTALGLRSLAVSESVKTPSWYEYLWFAFGAYYMFNKPDSSRDGAT